MVRINYGNLSLFSLSGSFTIFSLSILVFNKNILDYFHISSLSILSNLVQPLTRLKEFNFRCSNFVAIIFFFVKFLLTIETWRLAMLIINKKQINKLMKPKIYQYYLQIYNRDVNN
jgi:hypothetical protein